MEPDRRIELLTLALQSPDPWLAVSGDGSLCRPGRTDFVNHWVLPRIDWGVDQLTPSRPYRGVSVALRPHNHARRCLLVYSDCPHPRPLRLGLARKPQASGSLCGQEAPVEGHWSFAWHRGPSPWRVKHPERKPSTVSR